MTYYSWTGCYVGGNVGGVWVNKEWFSQLPGDPSFGQSFGSHDANSWLGGVQAGCNYQVGNWVFGIQGDYDWTNASGSNVNALNPGLTDSSKIKSLSSVTGRIGYAWDRFLGYVKGGGAWERDNYTVVGDPGGGPIIAIGSETRSGWTVGIGGEYAFTNNLTGFVEYDWYGFGTRTVNFAISDPTGRQPPQCSARHQGKQECPEGRTELEIRRAGRRQLLITGVRIKNPGASPPGFAICGLGSWT